MVAMGLVITFPIIWEKHCCDQNEESVKLLREQQLLEKVQIKNNFEINGAVKPHNVVRNISVLDQLRKQNIIIPEHKDELDSFRPILKAARQKSMNGCPNFSSGKDFEESFSFGGEEAKLSAKPPFLDGSSINIRSGEMILNSKRLFADKKLVGNEKLYT